MRQSIVEALYETFHRSRKHPKEIADQVGVSYSYLARAVLGDNPSGCNFPIRLLVPLMRAAGNYSALKVIARECGFLLVKPPRGNNHRQELYEYQGNFARLLQVLTRFLNYPDRESGRKVIEALADHMEQTSSWKYRCEKNVNQLEMEFEREIASRNL